MVFRKCFVICGVAAAIVLTAAIHSVRAQDLMTIRYTDGNAQTIRLERPSEAIKSIEFSEERRRFSDREYGPTSMRIVAATYGRNCGAEYGNVTAQVAQTCEGKSVCEYIISADVLGDPAPGCRKDFTAEWRCGGSPERRNVGAAAEASNSRVVLRCTPR